MSIVSISNYEAKKWSYYIKYITLQYSLKFWFNVNWIGETYYTRDSMGNELNWHNGKGQPDKIVGQLHFRYLWKNTSEPVSFDEFCHNKIPENSFDNFHTLQYFERVFTV